jgi:RecG-like helicase
MVGHQVAFLDPTLLLLGQPLEHFAQVFPQLNIQRFAATLGDKHHVMAGPTHIKPAVI